MKIKNRKFFAVFLSFLFVNLSAPFLFASEYKQKRINSINIGADIFRFEEETVGPTGFSKQKDKGNFEGGFFRYTTYNPLRPFTDSTRHFFIFETRYARGTDIKRTGDIDVVTGYIPVFPFCDTSPCPASDVLSAYPVNYYDPDVQRKQWLLEIKGVGGSKFVETRFWDLEGFIGFGFRYHMDRTDAPDPSIITTGKTSSSYFYLPFGLSTQVRAGWLRIKPSATVDWIFLASKNNRARYVYVQNGGYLDGGGLPVQGPIIVESVDNSFNSNGYGYKLAADFELDIANRFGVTVTPYYRFWRVGTYKANRLTKGNTFWVNPDGTEQSATLPGARTEEIGIQIAVLF